MFLKQLQLDSNPEPLSSKTNTQPFGQMVECSFTNEVVLGSSPVAVT